MRRTCSNCCISPSSAPASFLVEGAASGPSTKWQWATHPEILFRRPGISGNKTTVLRGIAAPIAAPAGRVAQGTATQPAEGSVRNDTTAQHADDESDQEVAETMVKATFVSTNLRGHEAHILGLLHATGLVPRLVGNVELGHARGFTSASEGERKGPQLSLDALAMQGPVGDIIPYDLNERDLTAVIGAAFGHFHSFSKVGVHYRDPHNGNLLFRREQGSGKVRLVLIDFGSARHGFRNRGQRHRDDDNVFRPREIGEDHARSGSKLFWPAAMHPMADAISIMSRNRPMSEPYIRAARQVIRCTHRYIDDAESCVRIMMLHGGVRSGRRLQKDGETLSVNGFDDMLPRSSREGHDVGVE